MTIEWLLSAVVTDYKANGRRAVAEVDRYKARLAAYFGPDRDAATLSAGEIDVYVESRRKEGAAVGTVNRELSCLRRRLRLAHQKGRLQAVPHVAVSAEHNVRTGFFEEHEVKALLGATAPDMALLFNFLYLTGWRPGEAIALEWRQVDFGAGVLRLEPGTKKNGDGRTFPFAALPELAAALREQRERIREVERQAGRIIPWVFIGTGQASESVAFASLECVT